MTFLSRLAAIAFVLCLSWALPAAAQPYPAKPIRILCAFPVGGIADVYGRIIAARLRDPVKDFAAVAPVLEAEGVLVVHPSVPVGADSQGFRRSRRLRSI